MRVWCDQLGASSSNASYINVIYFEVLKKYCNSSRYIMTNEIDAIKIKYAGNVRYSWEQGYCYLLKSARIDLPVIVDEDRFESF